jgi:hypothetical protein
MLLFGAIDLLLRAALPSSVMTSCRFTVVSGTKAAQKERPVCPGPKSGGNAIDSSH